MNTKLIIDSHQHFWKYDEVRYNWIDDSMNAIRKDFLPEDLEKELVINNVEGCIAVQADQSEAETEFLLNLAKQYDFIKAVVGWVDLNSKNVEKSIHHFAKNKFFKGVRHTVWDESGEFMLEPSFLNGISYLTKLNLSYDILVFDYQLASAVKMVAHFPDQKFILDHMGKPSFAKEPTKRWIENIYKLAEYPNVYCKLSGIYSDAAQPMPSKENLYLYLEVLLNAFGEKRLIFGSDWPVNLVKVKYNETIEVVQDFFYKLPAQFLEGVMRSNAVSLYRL